MDNNKEIDALLKTLTEQGIPGCALLVRRERAVIYEHYTGYADLELQKEMNADTLFRIYSMTKLYTCAAALQLCAENKLAFMNQFLDIYLNMSTLQFVKMERMADVLKVLHRFVSGIC